MSSRACPDWPALMELAPELLFKHYTVREAQLPLLILVTIDASRLDEIAICCDIKSHVFYANHTDEQVAEGLRASHWFDLREWKSQTH
jgi:hypothetical protein